MYFFNITVLLANVSFDVLRDTLLHYVTNHLLDNDKKGYNIASRDEQLGDGSGRGTVTGVAICFFVFLSSAWLQLLLVIIRAGLWVCKCSHLKRNIFLYHILNIGRAVYSLHVSAALLL